MNIALNAQPRTFGILRDMARKRSGVERCELCSAALYQGHQHLLEPVKRKIVCACDGCSILFSSQGETKLKRIPRRVQYLPDFQMTAAQWDSLMIPINMAFLFESTPDQRVVALYPSPAGPVESLLTLDNWNEIVQANPMLAAMQADVEALLVNRFAAEYFIAPIDQCYKLVGLIRGSWRGLSGGSEVWREIGNFFATLKEQACRT